MDVVFGWLFVSTFLSKVIQIESGIGIFIGTFRVLRKHPQLRQCADKALQKHVYVGARISDQTGVCEGLHNSWGRNQTIESGYGYVRNVHVLINYEPPIEGDTIIQIPGVLSKGAKMDIHLTWTKMIDLSCTPSYCVVKELTPDYYGVRLVVNERDEYRIPRPQEFVTSDQWKISFVGERNTLYFLVDDQVMNTMNLTSVRLNYVESVRLTTTSGEGRDIPISRIRIMEFTTEA